MSYSRYLLCDLQVHTVADLQQKYGNYNSKKPRQEFARDLVLAHKNAGVRIFAVTDHNQWDWYPVLRDEGEAIGVYVFPGVEISVNGCHLVLIWDRKRRGLDENEFIPALTVEPKTSLAR